MVYRNNLQDDILQQLIRLIGTHTGLQVRGQDSKVLLQKIETRVKALRLTSLEAYYRFLDTETVPSQQEWRQLALLLTTNETYFFRDAGQFSLLRNKILPELIERKRKERSQTGKLQLRLWSAGCSSGEEPYSLAILLEELLPKWENWDIFILGTDINLEALEKAKQGTYNSWSFRMVEPHLMNQYFDSRKDIWKIKPEISQKVTFQHGNLVKDIYPNGSQLYQMDLIICRNVFVYFDAQSIKIVLEKFHNTLTTGGYLIAGHAELYGQDLGLFKTQLFPESVVYQRQEHKLIHQSQPAQGSNVISSSQTSFGSSVNLSSSSPDWLKAKASPQNTQPPLSNNYPVQFVENQGINSPPLKSQPGSEKETAETPSEKLLKEANSLFDRKAYHQALSKAEELLNLHPRHFEAYYLMAQVYANLGNYQEASKYCKQAISVDSLAVSPHYLLAHIAEEQGDLETAKSLFKKIIYLAPKSVYAYIELASIYEQEGDVTRCLKMRTSALDLLKQMPGDAKLEQPEGTTAAELLLEVEKLLSRNQ